MAGTNLFGAARVFGVGLVAVAALSVVLLVPTPAHAADLVVDSTADTNTGACTGAANDCTLRGAINASNASSTVNDTINFAIPDDPGVSGFEVKTISPTSQLPIIRDRVIINGYTQPGAAPNTAIGTDALGAASLGNNLGNTEVGIRVETPGNFVGGTASGARNVISGNGGVGVAMLGAGASGNTVQGNHIGPDVNGAQTVGGNFHGVFVSDASNNTIGGTVSAASNTISGNDNHGVQIVGAGATGNRILRNSIFNNGSPGGLGIELNNDGVTANDPKDPDVGPNLLQNFPVITSASTTQIKGTLNSTKNKTFTIQLFSNPQPNIPTGFGEGQNFLGETTARTNKKGKASFTFNAAVPAGQIVTATATDPSGNTSEFSAGRTVQ